MLRVVQDGCLSHERQWRRTVKIAILSPHPGDAAFSLGLAVQTWLEAGHAVEVLNCFTRSEYSPFADLEFVHANDRRSYVTALRHREDIRWSVKYKPKPGLSDLGLRDGPQRRQCGVDEVCGLAVNPADGALEKIGRALERRVLAKKMDALLLPLGVGGHVDHLTARVAAASLYGGELPVAFFEDLPYAARVGGIEAGVRELAETAGELAAVFAGEAVAAEGGVARKRRLALCYDSQIDDVTAEMIAGFCAGYGGRERVWGNAAWGGGGVGGCVTVDGFRLWV